MRLISSLYLEIIARFAEIVATGDELSGDIQG